MPFELDAELHARVVALAHAERASLFMVLHAALAALLTRLGAGDDIPIGSPVAGRGERALEDLVGFFVNTLVIRTDVSGDPTFRELIARVRAMALEAYSHQDLPFERLVEAVQPARSLARHPLFQVMLVLQNQPAEPLALPGLVIAPEPLNLAISKFDLTLTLVERRATDGGPLGFEGLLEYHRDRFEPATAAVLATRFVRLLDAATRRPNLPLHEIDVISSQERRAFLEDFNATDRSYIGDGLVHTLFEAQAGRTPEAPALVFEDTRLTYRALDARANQLAHRLIDAGAGPDRPIGICLERSAEMVIAVLAVLKAGAASLPLDPEYPAERLAYMLADAGASLLLVHAPTRQRLRVPASCDVVDLDEEAIALAVRPATAVRSDVRPDHILYVIYTSGSTGRPKGTRLSHRALFNLLRWHFETLLTAVPTVQFASLSFDASFHEMFAALGTGGCLHVLGETERRDADRLVEYLDSRSVAKAILPVVMFKQIAAAYADRPDRLRHLRELITTGESLTLTPAACALLQRLPDCTLHNHYGPSETHVVTSYSFKTPPQDQRPPPIGRPIANTQVYVLRPLAVSRPDRIARRALHRRGQRGPRLPQPARPHRLTVRARPVRHIAGCAPLSDRRCGALAAGRRA